MGHIHAGRVETSKRLNRVRDFLAKRGSTGATTRDIVMECQVMAVSAVVAELRQNGIEVQCEHERRSEGGAQIYRYRLVERFSQLRMFPETT